MITIVNGMLIRDDLILMAKRSPERRSYPGTWSFPGGHIEPGETPEAALVRELGEEIAITPIDYRLLDKISDPNLKSDRPVVYHMYIVTAWSNGEPMMQGTEHTELRWFKAEEALSLEDLALPGHQPLLERLWKRRV